jgi:hypothetical protein
MVGRLFGSPSGQGGNATTTVQPLNTPKSSQSRRDRIEQARQDRSRRRNFGFLKTGNSEKKVVSTTALTRRREHAKQLANLAYSEDPSASAKHGQLTPTSRSAHQQLLSSFDVDSPQNATNSLLDPFSTTTIFANNTTLTPKSGTTTNNALFFDPHNVMATGSTAVATDREPTASTVDTLDNSSFGSTAFDVDFVTATNSISTSHPSPVAASSSTKSTRNQGNTTTPTNRIHRSNNKSKTYSRTLDNFFVETNDRHAASMPTIPSNSTMQANYHRTKTGASYQQHQQPSFAASSSGSVSSAQSNSGSIGAAARRRMRSHMRNTGSGSTGNASSNSSAGSASTNRHRPIYRGCKAGWNISLCIPESPASTVRSNSIHHNHNNSSATKISDEIDVTKRYVGLFQDCFVASGRPGRIWNVATIISIFLYYWNTKYCINIELNSFCYWHLFEW